MMLSLVKHADDASSTPFSFMFDCGSLNRQHLGAGLDLLDTKHVDVLFISHLDADHVNGIDMLMRRPVSVDTVVLPCLDPTTIAAYVLAEASGAGITTEFGELLSNPAMWFGRRGARRVIFLQRPAGDGRQAPGGVAQNAAITLGNPNLRYGLEVTLRTRVWSHVPATGNSAELFEVDADTIIDIASKQATSTTLWTLIPYNHPFEDRLVNAFHAAARTVIASMPPPALSADPLFTRAILRALAHKSERNVLKACYRILDIDGNVPSLSLYSGPPMIDPMPKVKTPYTPSLRAGWLTTGDAKLKAEWIQEPWVKRYAPLFDRVGVFVLPHHGSDHSIDHNVLQFLSQAQMLSCADSNSKKHPHKNVTAKIAKLGISHCVVSEKHESEYTTHAVVEI
ncbi:hypothetical protein BLA18112_06127 [Burkholderia lata]|uniref:Metallo-beta-lactamase domain-containing protein n=2 Tax=Burkholderia lata (strain ATCC 17760 / DSM 23089 / LMG 22485 / NCIMB 9086 / R18194 / 383) TaxID=482957 RepID=A0A6P2ZN81_BURL3|nr:hypothetical protein BLA18112_06127 [Burkholderia lata]